MITIDRGVENGQLITDQVSLYDKIFSQGTCICSCQERVMEGNYGGRQFRADTFSLENIHYRIDSDRYENIVKYDIYIWFLHCQPKNRFLHSHYV